MNMNLMAKYFANWEDRRLVRRFLQQREERVFREIYRRHAGRLYQLSLRLLGGEPQAAEEILQETWVRALEHLPDFQWQSSLRTWLSGIVVNCCREFFRLRAAQRNSSPAEELEMALPLIDHARRLDLEDAIAALPSGYRQVLILYDVEGYRHEEISKMLDLETGTSKSQLFHARRALRRLLEPSSAENVNRRNHDFNK